MNLAMSHSASELVFTASATSQAIWRRNMYGLESLVAYMAEKNDGFGAYNCGTLVTFPVPSSTAVILEAAENSWIQTRFLVPGIALKTKPLPESSPRNFFVEYKVPADLQDAQVWAKETIKVSEDKLTFLERDILMKNTYWTPADCHHNFELWISQDVDPTKWQFFLKASHYSTDARLSMAILDVFFKHMSEYLLSDALNKPSVFAMKWGSETERLAPAAALLGLLAMGGDPASLFVKSEEPTPGPQSSPTSQPVPFFRPLALLDEHPSLHQAYHKIQLTEEETDLFRAAARKHGYTVTQVVTAVMALAEAEWTMLLAQNMSAEHKTAAEAAYHTGNVLPSVWNIIDQRKRLRGYETVHSPKGTPTLGADGFPLMLDMNDIRKTVVYDASTGKIERRSEHFWPDVAKCAQECWKSHSLELASYIGREVVADRSLSTYVPAMYEIPALLSSSIGDIEQLGFLNSYSPAFPSGSPRIVIEQIAHGVRCSVPLKMVMLYQWNNRLTVRLHTSAKYTAPDGMREFGRIFQEWMAIAATA